MSEQMQKALRDGDLIKAVISGVVAVVIMSYVVNTAKPGIVQMVLALAAICATITAYLFVARANVEASYKAGTVSAWASSVQRI